MPSTLEKILSSRLALVILAIVGLGVTVAPFVEDSRLFKEPVGDAGPLSFTSALPLKLAATTIASASSAYTAHRAEEQDGQVLKFRYEDASGKALTFSDAMRHLAASDGPGAALRSQVIAALRDAPFSAVFWECAPVSGATASVAPFEFVVVSASALAHVTAGEPGAFAEHLAMPCAAAAPVATFANLGRDAVLVAPCPRPPAAAASAASASAASAYEEYAHFAPFVRRAPAEQVHALLQAVGAAVLARLGLALDSTGGATSRATPVWLSTSGLGVRWLHVRLDDRPKYYTYPPYKRGVDLQERC